MSLEGDSWCLKGWGNGRRFRHDRILEREACVGWASVVMVADVGAIAATRLCQSASRDRRLDWRVSRWMYQLRNNAMKDMIPNAQSGWLEELLVAGVSHWRALSLSLLTSLSDCAFQQQKEIALNLGLQDFETLNERESRTLKRLR